MQLLALFNSMSVQAVQQWIEAGGYVVLFGLLFACGLGLPLPEDIPLLISGVMLATGKMHLAFAAVAAWCGIIAGDCVLYHLGKKFGLEITRVPFIGRHVTKARIQRAEELFARWGIWVVAVGRLFAGIRGAMVIAAGATRFNFIKFIVADGLAALVSGGMFMSLGYWFGSNLEQLRARIGHYEHDIFVVAAVAGLIVGLYIWWRRRRHKTIAEAALERVAAHATHAASPAAERAPCREKNGV